MTLAAAFLLSWLLVGLWARALRERGLGKAIRADGPAAHLEKAGTPSMAGLPMALAAGLVWLLAGGGHPLVALAGGLFLLIGLADDLMGTMTRPLRAREKLALQLVAGALLAYLALTEARYTPWAGLDFLLYLLALVGAANALNFTDGLDGLAASVGAVLLLPFYPLKLVQAALGALLGFLWHNAPPARVFMGDAGSEALGAFWAMLYLVEGKLWYLPLAGLMPVLEVVSVILQVLYFKKTGGQRLFRMAPLHHHLELLGWGEAKIVARFTVLTAVFTALAVGLWGRA